MKLGYGAVVGCSGSTGRHCRGSFPLPQSCCTIRDMTFDLAASSAGNSLPCDLAEQHEPCRAHSTVHVLLFLLLAYDRAAVRVV